MVRYNIWCKNNIGIFDKNHVGNSSNYSEIFFNSLFYIIVITLLRVIAIYRCSNATAYVNLALFALFFTHLSFYNMALTTRSVSAFYHRTEMKCKRFIFSVSVNKLRSRHKSWYATDDVFKCILNINFWTSNKLSLKYISRPFYDRKGIAIQWKKLFYIDTGHSYAIIVCNVV